MTTHAMTDTRHRIRESGPEALSHREAVAALIAGPGIKDPHATAAALLDRFGGVRALLTADPQSLGIPEAAAHRLACAADLARRLSAESLNRGAPLTDPDATRRFLIARLRDLPHEVFACLFLDNRHRVIAFEELFRGALDGASVHPREVVKAALRHNAAALILAHNHPSGVAEPSDADRLITRRLREALGLVDIRVLDHFVVGDGYGVSFAERGLL